MLRRAFTSSCIIPSFVLTSLTSWRTVPRRRVLVASSNKKWSVCFPRPLNKLERTRDEMTLIAYPMKNPRTVPGGTPSASNPRLPAATPLFLVAVDTTREDTRGDASNFSHFVHTYHNRCASSTTSPLLTRDISYEYVPPNLIVVLGTLYL